MATLMQRPTSVATRPPSFFSRIGSAFKAASRSAVLAYTVNTWNEGRTPNYVNLKFESYVNEGYKKNELVFACLTTNAETAASVSLKCYSKKGHEEMEGSPLDELMEHPNPFMSQYDFWALTSVYEDIAGIAYWQKIRNKAGEVVSLFPLRPDYMKPVYSSVKFISAYKYCFPGEPEVEISPADVLVFKPNWDPLELRNAISPMAAAARVIDVDNSITDYLKLLEERGFQPASVISSKLKLQDPDVDDLLRRLRERYGGLDKADVPLILDSDATFQRTGMTMAEMNFDSLDHRDEARICMVFHIPPIIVGAKIGLERSTFANYQEARLSWWEDRLMPKYKHRSDVIDAQLAPEFGDDIETEFDFSRVPALQDKRATAWTRGLEAFKSGAITRNMFYTEIGMELLPPETGDVFVQSIAVTEVPIDGRPEPPPIPDQPTPPEPLPTDGPPTTPAPDLAPSSDPAKEGKAVANNTVSKSKDCYVLLSLANDPAIVAIQEQLKAKYPAIEWADASSFHITLVYANAVSDLQLVRSILPQRINTFSFAIDGIGTFDSKDGEKIPVYLNVMPSPGLSALQSGLAASFKSLDLQLSEYSIPDKWHPHITLGYMPVGLPLPSYDDTLTLASYIIQCSVDNDAGSFDVIWQTKTLAPVPDPEVILARTAPYTPRGQIQGIADVLTKREAELKSIESVRPSVEVPHNLYRPLSDAIHKTPTPEPDPAIIAARVAPHTLTGQLQAIDDVLTKREAGLHPAVAIEAKDKPVEPEPVKDDKPAEAPKADELAEEKAKAPIVPPFTDAEIAEYQAMYKKLIGATNA